MGDFRERAGINLVGGVLSGRTVKDVACGHNFTVIATDGKYVHISI